MVGSSKALSFHWCFVFSCQPASSPVRRRGRDFGDNGRSRGAANYARSLRSLARLLGRSLKSPTPQPLRLPTEDAAGFLSPASA
jgi:hypothetical protein